MRATRQRGVAVITALLLTTLAVSIVASLFWLQQVQVRSMENQRLHLQTKWIVRGALDWARLVLRQDGFDFPNQTTLGRLWDAPLAETRLDQYIERERLENENYVATLSGSILDAQSRYNLANLSVNQTINLAQVKVFGRLLDGLRFDPSLALRTAQLMQKSQPDSAKVSAVSTPGQAPTPPSDGKAPLEFLQMEDLLAVPGFTADMVAKLREFVIVLPEPTAVNVNTAPAEVLAAVVEFSLSDAQALVAARKTAYFKDEADFKLRLNNNKVVDQVKVAVITEYFLVKSKVRLDRAALDAEALIRRQNVPSWPTTLVWIREI